jgi:hypothetical protein
VRLLGAIKEIRGDLQKGIDRWGRAWDGWSEGDVVTIRILTTRFMGQTVCDCPGCQQLVPFEFRSLQATFQAVQQVNKTLDKPSETCQG